MPSTSITLYQFMPMPQDNPQMSSSPFCAKLEAYLLLTNRPYTTAAGQPPFAPTKSVPYVSYQGKKIGDSQAIINKLEAESGCHLVMERTLTAEQRTASRAVMDIIENKLYFALVYSRFVMDAGWAHQIHEVRFGLPWILRCCLPGMIRKEQVKKCAKHGFTTDATAFGSVASWVAQVSNTLGNKAFLFGDQPHVADCSLFGFLIIARANENANPLTTAVRNDARLMDFTARMRRLLKK